MTRLLLVAASVVLATVLSAIAWLALLEGPLEFHTWKVCQLTGEEDREHPGKPTGSQLSGVTGGVRGTDLGFSLEHGGKLYFFFGDTIENDPDRCEPAFCGTGANPQNPREGSPKRWASDAEWQTYLATGRDGADSVASAPINFDPEQCIPIAFESEGDGGFHPTQLNGQVLGRFEGAISAFSDRAQTMFAFFTVRDTPPGCTLPQGCALGDDDQPAGGQSKLALSRSGGSDFLFVANVSKQKFQWPVPIVVPASSVAGLPSNLSGQVVLIWGSGRDATNHFRHGYPYLAVAPLSSVASMQSWQYFSGIGAGKPSWSPLESAAQPLPPFGSQRFERDPRFGPGYHRCVGEFSVRYLEGWGKWLMIYSCGSGGAYNPNNLRGIHLRLSDTPWGPWSSPHRIFDPADGYCHFMHAQDGGRCKPGDPNPFEAGVRDISRYEKLAWGGEYAPFLLPSRYVKVDGRTTTLYFTMSTWNPYQVVLMKTRVQPVPWWRLLARWDYLTTRTMN